MKRILAITLALLLALSTFTIQAFAEEARKLEDVPHATEDPYGKYDPPIDIKLVHTGNDGAFWFPEGDSLDNNVYTRRYSEDLGINYSFLWTCPSSQAESKFNLMLASQELPDFMSVSRRDFEKLYAAGLLEDLTDPIIDYASDYLRERLVGDYAGLLDIATKDGRYYGIGAGATYETGASVMWLRKDYMDELNLTPPTTWQEFETFMETVKNNNPAGLSPAETYPIAIRGTDQNSLDYLLPWTYFNMFNSYPNYWYKNSKGEVEHGMFGEESRARTRLALEKAHELYEKGYITPSFMTDNEDLVTEAYINGKSSVRFGSVWDSWWPLPLTLDENENADWLPVAMPQGGDDVARMCGDKVQTQSILVACKGAKNPEALVKMSNLFMDLNEDPDKMEFGVYNTDPVDSNQVFLVYPLVIHNPAFNLDALADISAAQDSGDPSNLCEAFRIFYDQAMSYVNDKAKEGWPAYRSYLKEGTSRAVVKEYMDKDLVVWNEYTGDPTQVMIENEPTVKKLYDTMAVGIVSGELDISAFDEFVAQWDSIYGNTATKEVRDWCATR